MHATWEALGEAGVRTSSILRAHEIPVYHSVRSTSLAVYLYYMGFEKLDDDDHCGRTPLASLACPHKSDEYLDLLADRLDLAQRYLMQGMDPLHSCRDLCRPARATKNFVVGVHPWREQPQQQPSRYSGAPFLCQEQNHWM